MEFFRYHDQDGRLLRWKAVGDAFLVITAAWCYLPYVAFRGKPGPIFDVLGPLNVAALVVWLFSPCLSPVLYAFMRSSVDRALRLAISIVVCGVWLLAALAVH